VKDMASTGSSRVVTWPSGSDIGRINEVTVCRAWLGLRWMADYLHVCCLGA